MEHLAVIAKRLPVLPANAVPLSLTQWSGDDLVGPERILTGLQPSGAGYLLCVSIGSHNDFFSRGLVGRCFDVDVGPTAITRLEQMGIESLAELRQSNVDDILS